MKSLVSKTKKINFSFFYKEFNDTRLFFLSLIVTFILGLFAHGYGLLNFTISHDSLAEFYNFVGGKIGLGRFLVPIIRYVFDINIVSIWFCGVLSILIVGIAVYYVAKIFKLNKLIEIFLLSAIFITNASIIALIGTYMQDLFVDVIALFFSVFAVWIWVREKNKVSIKSILFIFISIFVSLGIYQAFFQVTISLACIYLIMEILQGVPLKSVVKEGLVIFLTSIATIVFYFIFIFVLSKILSIPFSGSDSGNDITQVFGRLNQLIFLILNGYKNLIFAFFNPIGNTTFFANSKYLSIVISVFNVFLAIVGLVVLIKSLTENAQSKKAIFFVLLLILILPFCMSCIMVISSAEHHLLRFSFFLTYVFILLLFKHGKENLKFKANGEKTSVIRTISIFLSVFVIICNMQVANLLYEKKDLQRQSTLSTMTRVINNLENMEGYVYNESKITMVGIMENNYSLSIGRIDGLTGGNIIDQINGVYPRRYQQYCQIVLQYSIVLCSEEENEIIIKSKEFKEMPCYPNNGSIKKINNVFVVKFGEEN